MNLRGYPWENVFNFVMASTLSGALLIVLWVNALRRETWAWMDGNLFFLTILWFGFVVPRILAWVRKDAR